MATEVEKLHTLLTSEEMPLWENALERRCVCISESGYIQECLRSIVPKHSWLETAQMSDGLRKDKGEPEPFTIAGMNSTDRMLSKRSQMQLVEALKQTGRTQSVVQGCI